jgi:hypothetical protein
MLHADRGTARHDETNGSIFETLLTRLKKPPLLGLEIIL